MRKYKIAGGVGSVCFSFDDYHEKNILIDQILDKQGIEATFYIETGSQEARAQIKELFQKGHEIGSHTIHHPQDLKVLHQVEAMGEIEGSKGMIESIIGRRCTSFCYPRGRFNDDIVELVKRAGFDEARTTHVLETSWKDPFRTGTTVHLYDGRKEYHGKSSSELIKSYFADVKETGGTLSIWGHAFEFDRYDMWKTFEDIVQFLGQNIEV